LPRGKRLERINDEIQIILSELLRKVKDPRITEHDLLSVSKVSVTGDLRYAKVMVSTMKNDKEESLLKGLQSGSSWLRRELGASLDLRYTPELIFEIDRSLEYGAHIQSLLNKLDIKQDEDEEVENE
jgi:ribosome-binding factor A